MYDFHKADLNGSQRADKLLDNPYLEFKTDLNLKTGEINEGAKEAEFLSIKNFCRIKNDKYVSFQFSFHKYFNKGKSNHNEFKISDFAEVLIDLSRKFEINPYLACLHNLEFGVNVILPFKTRAFLNAVINYKGKECEKNTYGGKGYLLRYSFDQYELKIYDKGFQYQLNDNILRFEIRVKKMEFLRAKGIEIRTYMDLLNSEKIQMLSNLLLEKFKEILIYDNSINLSAIKTQREREILLNGISPKYWDELKNRDPNIYKRKRTRFRELILKYSNFQMQEQVYGLITDKLKVITEIDPVTQQKILHNLFKYNPKTIPKITNSLKEFVFRTVPEITDFSQAEKKQFDAQNNHSSIGLERAPLKWCYFNFGRIELVL